MYSKRAFVHWYVGEGMEEGEFSEARGPGGAGEGLRGGRRRVGGHRGRGGRRGVLGACAWQTDGPLSQDGGAFFLRSPSPIVLSLSILVFLLSAVYLPSLRGAAD